MQFNAEGHGLERIYADLKVTFLSWFIRVNPFKISIDPRLIAFDSFYLIPA